MRLYCFRYSFYSFRFNISSAYLFGSSTFHNLDGVYVFHCVVHLFGLTSRVLFCFFRIAWMLRSPCPSEIQAPWKTSDHHKNSLHFRPKWSTCTSEGSTWSGGDWGVSTYLLRRLGTCYLDDKALEVALLFEPEKHFGCSLTRNSSERALVTQNYRPFSQMNGSGHPGTF